MDKKGCLFLAVILLSLFLLNVHAQVPDPEALQNDSVVKGVEKLQELSEEDRWQNISVQWKESLLQDQFISDIDTFLRKIDIVFVILFGRSYDLSLELLFAVILWAITFAMLPKYLLFLREKWMRYAGSFVIVVGLANTQLFNVISAGLFKLIFFKYEWYWKVIALLVVLVALIAYYIFLKFIGKYFKKGKEKKEALEVKKERAEIKGIVKGIETANKVDEYGNSGYSE